MNRGLIAELEAILGTLRTTYKKEMAAAKAAGDKAGEEIANYRQLAAKIIANALYGVVSTNPFEHAREAAASHNTRGCS